MEKHYTTYYNGIKIDVVEVKSDSNHLVQISVLGDPLFNKKPFGEFNDYELEKQGFKKLASCNGSLFFTEGTETFANGIEKSMGVIHENDDDAWNDNLGFYHGDSILYVYTQRYIKSIINQSFVRGAITSAFGLLNNGVKDISGAKQVYDPITRKYKNQPSRAIYLAKSGRTIVGKKLDGTMIMAVCDGVTGSSGLTGDQTVQLAVKLGLRNAVCMDGGGSTYLEYKGQVINSTSRTGANAIAFYIKDKPVIETGFKIGDVVKFNDTYTISSINGEQVYLKELEIWVNKKHLTY